MMVNFITMPKHRGGVGIAPLRLAQALERRGHEIIINAKEKSDIVHIHNVFSLRRFKGVPTVVHGHSVRADLKGGVLGYQLFKYPLIHLMKQRYQSADHIIAVSEFAAEDLIGMGITNPISIISNGIPLDEFPYISGRERENSRDRLIQRYNLDPEKKIVLCVGSLMPRKGISEVVNLAKILPDVEFLWVGKSQPIYPYWILRIKLGNIPRNLRLIGYVEDIRDLYQGADIYLNASHVETEGLPILEAAASGTPMIIRNIPAFSNWTKYSRTFSSDKELIQLIKDSPEGNIHESARKHVLNFNIDIIAKQIEKIYGKMI